MISSPGQRAPYAGTAGYPHAPNAALLIDFDNVTMGIRSDLGKELKSLLNSDVIRGKVAVQRAYADWRRYPQYIVPLAESSIDLIFAPAYGSSKKNATDLRMAIDAIELVFTRPEIGTFILMTGDSDFSSCVLKLKEYGKYVIGVGMRESSSDLLIQNCDEYYSYHSLSGLTRTGEVQESTEDPWVLMKRAAQQMEANDDVMRTDRLKQVMLDLDPSFDEKKIGYSKFSRFVQEAATKGIVRLRKGENGQYELVRGEEPEPEAEAAPAAETRRGRGRERDREGRRDGRREGRPARKEGEERPAAEAPREEPAPKEEAAQPSVEPAVAAEAREEAVVAVEGAAIDHAYSLLQAAVRDLTGGAARSVRDGDVKRRMLDMAPGFDEADLGFSKFTRFLRQAHDAEVIDLQRSNGGNYEVALPASGKRLPPPAKVAPAPAKGRTETPAPAETEVEAPAVEPAAVAAATASEKAAEAGVTAVAPAVAPTAGPAAAAGRPAGGVGALRGRRAGRPGAAGGPPPILPGQAVAPTPGARPVEEAPAAAEKPAEEVPAAAEAAATTAPATTEETRKKSRRGRRGRGKGREAEAAEQTKQPEKTAEAGATEAAPTAAEPAAETAKRTLPPEGPIDKITARARRGRAIRGDVDEAVGAPPILPGQAVTPPAAEPKPQPEAEREAAAPGEAVPEAAPRKGRGRGRGRGGAKKAPAAAEQSPVERALAGLPTDRDGVIAQLTSYRGVGQKTAESLYDRFEGRTFEALQHEPAQVRELLGDRRAGTLLEQWGADLSSRLGAESPSAAEGMGEAAPEAEAQPAPEAAKKPASRGRGGRSRTRGGSSRSASSENKAGEATAEKEQKSSSRGGRGSRGGGRRKKETAPSS